ncbi:MAG: glucose-6-phosphate isomerase [Candidatus Saccharibacteria bacterium]|nr:glucose-6-phosphate isomerase [Candidatus Saccharibacteria bacterium]
MIQVNFNPRVELDKIEKIIEEIKSDSMGGWADLPLKFDTTELQNIKDTAEKIRKESEVLVCVGIGGSYLGHRAIIEALRPHGMEILYVGNSLSKRELDHTLRKIGNRDFSVNVISKSGTTLEPAMAFEAVKQKLAERYGVVGAIKRIYATTDAKKGTLHAEAVRDNYTRFKIPNNIGGRYSVLSPVGLLPMAVAGININELLRGAAEMAENVDETFLISDIAGELELDSDEKTKQKSKISPAIKYAVMRHLLSKKGYDTEVFATFEPATAYFNEWIKQLFGESEGKNRQGIFPASVVYSTDLHSLGQFMQDGRRNLWETIINYPTDELNAKVVEAVQTAHIAGRIPVLKIDLESYDERGFGSLIYFFEMACAISAKLQGVNPFDQPGVEAYKEELRKLMEEK